MKGEKLIAKFVKIDDNLIYNIEDIKCIEIESNPISNLYDIILYGRGKHTKNLTINCFGTRSEAIKYLDELLIKIRSV